MSSQQTESFEPIEKMSFEEFENSLPPKQKYPKTVHYHENNRIVTIVYDYNEKTYELRYGATVFEKNEGENWNRKSHVHTASGRLKVTPVILSDYPREQVGKRYLRRLLFKCGVKGERIEVNKEYCVNCCCNVCVCY